MRASDVQREIDRMTQNKQEPVGFMNAGHVHEMQQGKLPYGYVYPKRGDGTSVAVYTTPPQRTWVGLTDEEVESLQRLAIDPVDANGWGFLNRERYAHLIEAKLKEKNG